MSALEVKFGFSRVTLLKDQALGRGSYGSVCKARCDQLTCAAKIIHPLLFDLTDPGVRTMIGRFEQECRLLAALRHPKVIQYLGTHTDPDSGLPVLLMELMDQNLTHYLESRAPRLLPFHLQLNLSLDVTSALSYLHSNSVLHRDLSSNNILLLGERAKVTDFGMSRLEGVNPRMTPATTCPGTLCYMPPEALRERPTHTDKLDVFSFGVVLLQVLTGKFPEPSERFTTMMVPDPSSRGRTLEAQVPVREAERRRGHLRLVPEDSPLRAVTLSCLQDRPEDRPTASAVCEQLEEVRGSGMYRESVETASRYGAEGWRLQETVQQQEARIEELQGEIQQQEARIEELQGEMRTLQQQKETVEGEKRTLQQLIEDKQFVIEEKDRIVKALTAKANSFALRWRKSRNAPAKFRGRGYAVVVGSKAYFYALGTIYEFDTEKESWSTLPDPPEKMHPEIAGSNIVSIYNLFLTYVSPSGKLYTYMGENATEKWVEKFPPIVGDRVRIIRAICTSTRDKVLVFPELLDGYILDLHSQQWTNFEIDRCYSYYWRMMFQFVHKGILYQAAGIDLISANTDFLSCPESDIPNMKWKSLKCLPHYYQTPVSFNRQILGLGGRTDYKLNSSPIKTIHRYDVDSDQWVKFGEMEVARGDCMVAVVGDKMIVVGGEGDTGEDTSRTDIATVV